MFGSLSRAPSPARPPARSLRDLERHPPPAPPPRGAGHPQPAWVGHAPVGRVAGRDPNGVSVQVQKLGTHWGNPPLLASMRTLQGVWLALEKWGAPAPPPCTPSPRCGGGMHVSGRPLLEPNRTAPGVRHPSPVTGRWGPRTALGGPGGSLVGVPIVLFVSTAGKSDIRPAAAHWPCSGRRRALRSVGPTPGPRPPACPPGPNFTRHPAQSARFWGAGWGAP